LATAKKKSTPVVVPQNEQLTIFPEDDDRYRQSIFQSWPAAKRFKLFQSLVDNQATSLDPRTKVAALLLSKPGQLVSTGVNSPPKSTEESLPLPMRTGNNMVPQYVIHAEEDAVCALANKQIRIKPVVAAVSRAPCVHCLAMLHRIGIQEIVWFGHQKDHSGQELARYLGIRWIRLELPKQLLPKE